MINSEHLSQSIFDGIENKIDRAMIVLFYKWGLTYFEIGECFDIESELVEEIMSGAIKKIRKEHLI